MNIVSRKEWGAKPATSRSKLVAGRVTTLVLHHTTGSYAGPQTVRNIQKFHQGPSRKWADIAYSFLVAPDGTIFEGRGWDTQGAHARGHNATSIGVAYIGDGSKPVPVEAQRSIVWLAEEAEVYFGKLRRVGHRDVGATACPGTQLYAWWTGGAAVPKKTAVKPAPAAAVKPETKTIVPPVAETETIVPPVEEPAADPFALKPSWVSRTQWTRLAEWVKSQQK